MTHEAFNELVSKGIVFLDGAMGSNLRLAGMPVGVCTELWAMEHPQVVIDLQRQYIEAGTNIIFAPTFSANRVNLSMHGLEDRTAEINATLVSISREASQGRALVAGEITTTGKALEPKGDMSYDALLEIYKEQIQVLVDSGVDLLGTETMLSMDETMCALEAAQAVCDLPVMCMMTMEADGNLIYGGSAVEAVETLQAMGAAAVGLNCSVGPDQLESVVSAMKSVAELPVIAKPNAGMPIMDEHGMAHYTMDSEAFGKAMRKLVWRGARIVGGCCGTTPAYIRSLVDAVRDL